MGGEAAFHGTTILALRVNGRTVLAGDGQVTLGQTVMKHGAKKVRRLFEGRVLVGFAGATADAFTLLERFEQKLTAHQGNLTRAAVELARDWRTDKVLRRLEALMLAADAEKILMISGNGDVLEPDEPVAAVGSGGPMAQAAAAALLRHTQMDARAIAEAALKIAGELCIYTNDRITMEEL
ncbi:MAG: ATP-dependent protease subunit HslV [Thermodesulfobacteriota bacterium]